METDITVVTVEAVPAVVLRARASTFALGKVMASGYGRLRAFVETHDCGLQDGAPFCVYRNVRWDRVDDKGIRALLRMLFAEKWDIEMGIPVKAPVEEVQEPMGAGAFPEGTYLRTVHTGPYNAIRTTYRRLRDAARERGMLLGDVTAERYLNSPQDTPVSDLRTEVLAAVRADS